MSRGAEEVPLDWRALSDAGRDGQLMQVLAALPRMRWAERGPIGITFIHCACLGPNVAAVVMLLTSGLVDVNARDKWGHTPAHFCAANEQPRALEVLCAAGASMRARDERDESPMDCALWWTSKRNLACARALVANGVRLSTVGVAYRQNITPELEAFERGVLRCRAAVVAMLRVKQAGQLVRWDKFLLRELAVCIWPTRFDKDWDQ